MIESIALLGAVTVERISELFLARRNTKRLLQAGAVEVAARHYPLIVALHGLWIAGLWLLAIDLPIKPFWLSIFIALQALRIWTLATLGRRWTTRIIVLPDAPLVTRGPYRFISHPNYAVVIGEIAVLPLAFGMVWYAVAFSLANAAILTIRIRAENHALHFRPDGRHA